MKTSTVRPMIIGPRSPDTDVTMTAASACTTSVCSPAMTGLSRRMAATMPRAGASCVRLLSRYGFIVAGAALGVMNLHVFRRRLKQMPMGAGGEDLAFHQENDLVVVLDRSDLLRHGDQRHVRVVSPDVLENRP